MSPPTQQSLRDLVMKPVVYGVAGMDQVKVTADLQYSSVSDPNLLLDVYTSPNLKSNDRLPVVVFIHGAAGSETKPKEWGFYKSWGRLVAASGMAAVIFTHRLSPRKTSLEAAANDLTTAIKYFRSNADSLHIDKNQICLAAYSAGGPLLSWAMRENPEYVRCLVAFYAFMDLQQPDNLFAPLETPATLQRFSPITYLANDAQKIVPLFIARAGGDQVPTMNASIDRFIALALARNFPLIVANHPLGVHGFDNQNDDDRSREIIQAAIAFMKLHLGLASTRVEPFGG